MSGANAWLLDIGEGKRVAIGPRELVQIIDGKDSFDVPLTPPHVREVIFWQDRVVPVMQLPVRLGRKPCDGNILALVAYYDGDARKTAMLGAIHLAAPPVRVYVDDQQAVSLEDEDPVWRDLAISCFEQQGQAVPVLHLGRLFSASQE